MAHDLPVPDAQTAPDVAALQALLDAALNDVKELRSELEETNRGVVALYSELDVQAEELRHATELKSRFLAYMSHEFRTPIGSIRSICRLLIDRVDGPLTSEQERQVRFVETTATEFGEMVNDLLDLAKVEAGRVAISPAWFELVDVFAALRGMFKPVLKTPDLLLVFEEPMDLPRLFSDDRMLAQILRNFISNALKFTARGEVRVSARCEDDRNVTFAVTDTGIGIAPEFHHAVFDDFVQIDSPIQKRLRGTGLGLSLSKRFAELLGGTVGLESELGRGSTFWVRVPVRLAPVDGTPTPGNEP
jgi:signal transduction histidine kinase